VNHQGMFDMTFCLAMGLAGLDASPGSFSNSPKPWASVQQLDFYTHLILKSGFLV